MDIKLATKIYNVMCAIEGVEKGRSVDSAIIEAKRWGLSGLEPVVRTKLEEAKAASFHK